MEGMFGRLLVCLARLGLGPEQFALLVELLRLSFAPLDQFDQAPWIDGPAIGDPARAD